MKIETLKSKKRKYFLYVLVVGVALLLPLVLSITFGKYQTKESIKLAEGSITYKPYELNIVAVNIENDNGEYTYSEDIPTSGYYLDDSKSYCEVKNVKDNSIKIEYTGSKLEVTDISKKGTRCYAYFNKTKSIVCPSGATACETIVSNTNTIGERTNFSKTVTATTTGIMYQTEDNDGTSYYFAGAPTDNWVKFGGFYWRIVRINGNGSIRLIYNGLQYFSNESFGKRTLLDTFTGFNNNTSSAYVGYMYGDVNGESYVAVHANINNSNVKNVIDEWYENNLLDYANYLDIDAGFCNDRTPYTEQNLSSSGGGYGNTRTYYGGWIRTRILKSPTLKCFQTNDLFTTSSSNKGNKALVYPIGLITADEVAYAGGVAMVSNKDYYLFNGEFYWTMTPADSSRRGNGEGEYITSVDSDGAFDRGFYIYGIIGVRPVINLKADTTFSGGNGTITNPYVVS